MFELREYELIPAHVTTYLKATVKTAGVRKALVPLVCFSLPETGGPLNLATHLYYYSGGHDERNAKRAIQANDSAWKDYLSTCRPCVHKQVSSIFCQANIPGMVGLDQVLQNDSTTANFSTRLFCENDSILEYRRYQLKLGYDTVPKFLDFYRDGLPSKLENQDSSTSLVSVLYSDVGRLNQVIEIWRHGDGTAAMERSRVAARQAHQWRSAIANIAELAVEFTTSIHKPMSFSPLQ